MRVSGVWSLAGAVIVALVIADLWRNYKVTNSVLSTAQKESTLIAGR